MTHFRPLTGVSKTDFKTIFFDDFFDYQNDHFESSTIKNESSTIILDDDYLSGSNWASEMLGNEIYYRQHFP